MLDVTFVMMSPQSRLLGTCLERLAEVVIGRCPEERPVKLVLASAAEDGQIVLQVGSPDAELERAVVDWLNEHLLSPRPMAPELSDFSLALVLVKGIAQYHDGQLVAKSGPGKGLSFELSLPVFRGESIKGSD